jgi:hypothetical protein
MTNGVEIYQRHPKFEGCHHVTHAWEIVFDGGAAYIGRVHQDLGSHVQMSPVYQYVCQPNIRQIPQTGAFECGAPARMLFPIEMMGSTELEITIRFSRRIKLSSLDKTDIAAFDQLVDKAVGLQKSVLAARAGITLETEMPKGPPPRLV